MTELRKENQRLKEMVADLVLRYDIVKKLVRAGLTVKFNKYMRFTASEKQELINIVVGSQFGVNKTLREIGLNKSTFYNWYKAYSDHGVDGLAPSKRTSRRQWNSIPQEQKILWSYLRWSFLIYHPGNLLLNLLTNNKYLCQNQAFIEF